MELSERREFTDERIRDLQGELQSTLKLIQRNACVYATGSFGRGEASRNSDLDLFIVSRGDDSANENSRFRRLDEICVKADLVRAVSNLGIPEFDGDGKYLVRYSVSDLVGILGQPEDDAKNTFTARLLLLLESRPLLGSDLYQDVINDVIAAYWDDYADHSEDFVPAFLANDILRLWRTFCVNYEARTEKTPEPERIKRKVKNYTLKHSRMLTCFSALIYLLFVYQRERTVSVDAAKEMVSLTPLGRLEWLASESKQQDVQDNIEFLLRSYETFLHSKDDKRELLAVFSDPGRARSLMAEAQAFAEHIFKLIGIVGEGGRLHRLIVV